MREGDAGPRTTRRRLLAAAAGAVGGVAGCYAGANEVTSSSEYFGIAYTGNPERDQLNPWSPAYPRMLASLLFEPLSVSTPGDGPRSADLLESVEIDGTTASVRFRDGYRWWNGEPVTARDKWVKDRITRLRSGVGDSIIGQRDGINNRVTGPRSDRKEAPTVELLDDYTLRYEFDRPTARPIVFSNVLNGLLNTPVWIFDSWRQRFEDAATEAQRVQIAEELSSMTIGLEAAADRGVGCSPYEFEEVSSNRLILRRFDDHPRADELSIPRIWLPVASGESVTGLIQRGWTDAGPQFIADLGIDAPDYIEQLATYPITDGQKLSLNWENVHLARRNVRRAILCALPLDTIVNSGGGDNRGRVATLQTGLTLPPQRRWLDPELRDSLHRYPVAGDTERAAAFMGDAGYEREGGAWFDPAGNQVHFDLLTPTGYASRAKLIEQALDTFGFRVSVEQISGTSFITVVQRRNYDLLMWGTPGTPHGVYDVTDTRISTVNVGADSSSGSRSSERPVRPSIPSDPGDIDGGADRTINLFDQWERIRNPSTPAETRAAVSLFARWWNYDLPDIGLWTAVIGVWGNTRDFEWPAEGSRAYRTFGYQPRPEYHLIRTGAVRQARSGSPTGPG